MMMMMMMMMMMNVTLGSISLVITTITVHHISLSRLSLENLCTCSFFKKDLKFDLRFAFTSPSGTASRGLSATAELSVFQHCASTVL